MSRNAHGITETHCTVSGKMHGDENYRGQMRVTFQGTVSPGCVIFKFLFFPVA